VKDDKMSRGKNVAVYVRQCSIKRSVWNCVNYHDLAYKLCWTEIQWLSLGFLERLVFLSKGGMAFGTPAIVQKPAAIVQYARLVHWCNYKHRNWLFV